MIHAVERSQSHPRWKPAMEAIAWAGAAAGLLGLAAMILTPSPPPPRIFRMSPKEAGEWIALIGPTFSAVAVGANTLWALYHRITAPKRPKPRRKPPRKPSPDAPKAA